MRHGFLYLCAILDSATRKVLDWRLSNTLTTDFCTTALREALACYGTPEIFNTDRGCQFTSAELTDVLKTHDIQISMDGRGRCHDSIFVEHLWWTVKHEWVYSVAETGEEEWRVFATQYSVLTIAVMQLAQPIPAFEFDQRIAWYRRLLMLPDGSVRVCSPENERRSAFSGEQTRISVQIA